MAGDATGGRSAVRHADRIPLFVRDHACIVHVAYFK